MATQVKNSVEIAQKLMDAFAQRTGLTGTEGNIAQRYLWTDALAVQTFFALAHAGTGSIYKERALQLIDEVHHHLGRHHPQDGRKGWISGLPEEKGQQHPTKGGLRIGKALRERRLDEPFDDRLEWDRDGQYFHYITRWIQALLHAVQETRDKQYAVLAAELILATGKFIYKTAGGGRMYWKMSTDLSYPLVKSMGAHDPMEGLICAMSIVDLLPDYKTQMQPLINDFSECCEMMDWATTDPLGIGGLLLNIPRVTELESKSTSLPPYIKPEKLLEDSLYGLETYRRMHQQHINAWERLAFRECGLSLGMRVVMQLKNSVTASQLNIAKLEKYISIADDIEAFWIDPKNQSSPTWTEHLDINTVTLAASLAASR
jgi:hypothetical protein